MSFRSCRDCAKCTAGLVGYCDQTLLLNYMGMRMDGSTSITRDGSPVFGSFFGQSSLAAHALAYADNCVKVDPELDLTLLAPYGCGFQTGAGTVLNVLKPGDGRQPGRVRRRARSGWPRSRPPRPRASSRSSPSTRWPAGARSRRGSAPPTLDPTEGDQGIVERVKELTGGGATYGIDTTAKPEVVKQAQQSLGVRGTLVALGLGAEEYVLDAIDLLQAGKTVMSSIEGDSDPQEMVPRLIEMRAAGTFPMDDLVTTYPADEINRAVAEVTSGAVVKPVLVW